MKIFLKNVKIIDSSSAFNLQTVDIKIVDGIIVGIGAIESSSEFQIIARDDLHVSQGWLDSSVCFGEPGFEDRETIENGLNVAAKSGFTGVCVQPNTFPVVDNQAQVHFLKSKAAGFPTDLYPIGSFTKNGAGQDMAELFDMKNAGAIAFGDYATSTENANLLKIGLQYLQDFDGVLVVFCQNSAIKGSGIVNESATTIHLGLKGIPNLAEEIDVARNLFLLEYAGGKLHLATISTAKSVALVRQAKAKGLQVTCSVAVHHLVLTDSCLENFDSRYKVIPPLRTNEDRKALIDGVLDGTIDIITSDHNPIDIENKKVAFNEAKDGTIGLESAFAALMTVLPITVIIEKFTAAKAVFGIPTTCLAVGSIANLTLFAPSDKWIFSDKNIYSKSKNSAFLGQEVAGAVHGIINNKQLVLNNF